MFLTADPGNGEVALTWSAPDTAYYGDILLAECFPSCEDAINIFTITHMVDNGSGGWFRYSDGDTAFCGTGMIACADGGEDDFGARAGYSSNDPYAPVDSRLITGWLDLTSYTTATLEFIEAYSYSGDAHDSNMVEVSTDSGATWDVVYSSDPSDVGDVIVGRAVDISSYAGQHIQIAFRYLDAIGYGEAWFIDNIRLWGGTSGRSGGQILGEVITLGKKENGLKYKTVYHTAPNMVFDNYVNRTSPCGAFQTYNVYANGSYVGNTTETEYTATGLTNFTEYCFTITAEYAEGESDTSFNVCIMPLDPFIVTPTDVDITVGVDEYFEASLIIANHDTAILDFSIFSMETANLEVALELMSANFDMGLWGEMYDSEGLWQIGDSIAAASQYVEYPEWDGLFAYYNDDAIGSGGEPTTALLATNNIILSGGDEKVYLMMDMFYPQLGGHCGDPDGVSGEWDHAEIVYSIDGGATWLFLDSNFVNPNGWTKLLYNLTPYVAGQQIIQAGVLFDDCGGAWAYGIGVDNVAVKVGDDFSWLTISPYEGKIDVGDTVNVAIGTYGVMDGFSASETAILTADPYETNISINMQVGESGIDLPDGIPAIFALHQNYPNPFNPTTNIQFDIPEVSFARMDIYNILGKHVRTLFHDALEPGYHAVQWDGKGKAGEFVPTGMYIYKLHAGRFIDVKKLVLMK
jgi:hypothetical protein